MAASATFAADFSSILREIDRVEAKMATLSLTPRGVESAFDRMQRSFSGAAIIQQAEITTRAIDQIGGVSKLTGTELQRAGAVAKEAAEKMRLMGVEVPPKMQALVNAVTPIPEKLTLAGKAAEFAKSTFGQMFGAFTAVNLLERAIGTIVGFGREAFTTAGKTQDLSEKLGVSTDAIQEWDHIAKQTGTTLENFASSAFKLQTRLAGGGSVAQAVADLGLEFQKLRSMSPEQQFDTVVAALGRMDDAQKRNTLGVQIFGKNFEGIAAAAVKNYEEMGSAASKSSQDQIKALADAGDEWDKFKGRVNAATQGALASILKFSNEALKGILFEGNRAPTGNIDALLDPRLTQQSVEQLTDYVTKLREVKAAVAALKPETRAQLDAAIELGMKTEELVDRFGLTEEVLGLYKTTLKGTTKETSGAARETERLEQAMKAFLSEANNAEGLKKMNQDLALLNSTTSEATKKLQAMVMSAETAVVRSQIWNQGKGLMSALLYGPGNVSSQNVSKEFEQTFTGLLGGLKKGFDALLGGLTGGNGIGGFLNKMGTGIAEGFGNLISGGLTSLISGGINLLGKGLSKLFGGLFGGEGKKANDFRDQLISAAGGFDVLNEKAALAGTTLQKLLNADKVKEVEAAWKDLQGVLSDFDADQQRLNAAIEKYGFSIEELGPKLQKQELDKQAKELIEDWRVLVDAGVGVATVNERMAETVNDYLKTALKVGAEIPAAMKPILESMIEQGTLVDENGEKITDLEKSGIKFSETMTQGFDRIVKKLDELIERLSGAGSAIRNLPDAHVRVIYDDPGFDQSAATTPGYASGTRGQYLDFGSGTRVTLHGRERVMTESEGRSDAMRWAALDALAGELSALRADFRYVLPQLMKDAILLTGAA